MKHHKPITLHQNLPSRVALRLNLPATVCEQLALSAGDKYTLWFSLRSGKIELTPIRQEEVKQESEEEPQCKTTSGAT